MSWILKQLHCRINEVNMYSTFSPSYMILKNGLCFWLLSVFRVLHPQIFTSSVYLDHCAGDCFRYFGHNSAILNRIQHQWEFLTCLPLSLFFLGNMERKPLHFHWRIRRLISTSKNASHFSSSPNICASHTTIFLILKDFHYSCSGVKDGQWRLQRV